MNIDIIWERCTQQERKAQSELYQYFAGKMFSVCLRYANDHAEAEDILQNGFVKVFTKHHLFDGKGSLEGWIRRIMVNTAIELHRKKKIRYVDFEQDNSFENQAISQIGTDQTGYKDLMQLISDLPLNYRTIFNMYAIEGYNHREIAESLGITETNSKSQLSRARTWLKERLAKMEEKAL